MPLIHSDNVEALIAETLSMTAVTKQPPTMDTPDALAEYLTSLTSYLARSGEIYATAKLLLQEQYQAIKDVMEEDYKKKKATEVKADMQYRTRRTDYLIDLSERLNHNLVHEGNNVRKQIQYITDQMHNV